MQRLNGLEAMGRVRGTPEAKEATISIKPKGLIGSTVLRGYTLCLASRFVLQWYYSCVRIVLILKKANYIWPTVNGKRNLDGVNVPLISHEHPPKRLQAPLS